MDGAHLKFYEVRRETPVSYQYIFTYLWVLQTGNLLSHRSQAIKHSVRQG
jgi:hypothetical protein